MGKGVRSRQPLATVNFCSWFGVFLVAALSVFAVSSSIVSHASDPLVVWIGDNKTLRGVDTGTNQFSQTITLDRVPSAAAVDPGDNSIWTLQANQLVQFNQGGQILRRIDLRPLSQVLGSPKTAVLDSYDSSLWVISQGALLHVSSAGNKLFDWSAPGAIQSFDLDIDQSAWVLTKKQLIHLSVTGTIQAAVDLKNYLDNPAQLAVDSLGGIVWVSNQRMLLQFNLFDLSQPPRSVDLSATPEDPDSTISDEDEDRPPRIKTLNTHPLFGTVWLVSRNTLYLVSRQGSLLGTVDLLPFQFGKIKTIAYDPVTSALWLGGKNALGRFTSAGDFVARLPVDKSAAVIGLPPFKLLPTLSLVDPPDRALTNNPKPTLRLGLGTSCNSILCIFPDSYIHSLIFDLNLNGQAVGPLFSVAGSEATFTPIIRLPDGLNSLSGTAQDLFGHRSDRLTASFTVDTVAPRFVALNPTDGSTVTAGAITVSGQVDDSTANVILGDASGSGISMAGASFSFAVVLRPGPNSFTLTARDPAGNATAIPLRITYLTLPTLLSIASPVDQATINSNTIAVAGAVQGPDNTGVTVNGIVATVLDGSFYVNNLPLQAGSNTLTVMATTPDGQTVTKTVTVTSTGPSPFRVAVSPQSGVAPLRANFTVVNQRSTSIQNIAVDYNGDGIVDFNTTDTTALMSFTYSTPGVYQPKITVTDNQGATSSETLTVVVYDSGQRDRLFANIWNGMNGALTRGDIVSASNFLNASARIKYSPVFEGLQSRMPQIVASYSLLRRVSISEDIGEYAVVRNISGRNRLYLIYFLRDADGVWRVDGM